MCLKFKNKKNFQENFVKLIELERDLVGIENLVNGNRVRSFLLRKENPENFRFFFSQTFLRQGSLHRFSKKGSVQRLFVLFDDCLLYANRHAGQSSTSRMTFKLHGQIPLRGLMVRKFAWFKYRSNSLEMSETVSKCVSR